MGAVSRESKKVIVYPVGEESRDTAEVFITQGVFHFWSDKHLHRYISEFANKANKASIAKDFIEYANGKRLTYKELIK